MPVNQGVVETDLESFSAKSVNPGAQEVATSRGIGGFVIGKLRIPEAEALVVLRCDDGITHTSFPGLTGPGDRVVKIRIEVIKITLIVLICELLTILYPFVAGGKRVQPPVNKKAETIMDKP